MATILTIQGGRRLKGEITIAGNKNAATPLIAVSLLISGTVRLTNVPRILDVFNMIELLKGLNVSIDWHGPQELWIDARSADSKKLDDDLVKSMRSSVLLMGPLLARFKKFSLSEPGGCILGNRPLETHYGALAQLGADIQVDGRHIRVSAKKLVPTDIILPEFSVTATENIIMAAVGLKGITTIRGAAIEPHVQELIQFLNSAGARIILYPQHRIEIHGGVALKSVEHRISGDPNEFATLAVIAATAGTNMLIKGVRPDHNEMVLLKLKSAGVSCALSKPNRFGEVSVSIRGIAKGKSYTSFKLQALPFPGFPTDAESPFTVLATQSQGMSLIHDPLYESRLVHIPDLVRMGAKAFICDPHRVIIIGKTQLFGQRIKSLNLRAGGTLLAAGLIAQGETTICDAEIIDRGYQELDKRLNAVGADITRIET
ncbi:MAG: UDP-N-acetylglucosamine 1-carboxyvinyltransferase [Candidatus Jacksonbacteria bacterium RIFCSPLOWO2_02_FULL_43_9]|nr:MAG: UDP-N-acetylglucosamine 1-carboxyvinyltransferase [Parcubacteria group bacterium GW2011_GWA2_43_13]OGY69724.1 MAG: UDP-N-acetylglucosamine 1-carboxyvinyltransferase [Candidatus Jacksonbacteria bacterium RIFCSPHIGHO2_02_FULL_43_10]OGY71455.1 MAG: UDP-N-acetylglucosamine 1-carboxyvinyltransferase [Candidatus Jacksonbacteria bacterium RIFCSPLOWO2_01_FULL_44_13]OGY72116.1 MAG: UDP-N-acetylglucosamine 1-carboxyvinyltransferase [Candidatus Jacksonbacteria bacterium RIFCSPLOWO2_02_FULL_43_9]HA